MAEYIEREAARPDAFCVGVSCQECPFLKDRLYGGCKVDDFIKAVPAADVAPVVRCKDCKHGTRLVCDLAGHEGIECRHGNIAHRLDWFCADGAKMDTQEVDE